jgi:hypothetical protein
MADQLQLRGGSTAQTAAFTGALREVTVDTDKKTVVVHDGTTAGGNPLLRQDLSNLPAGTIDNADINASAGIVDTKLATIATAGKVSNSATTATSANTNSAIVARDASGNFTAGTITAALTGAASSNVLKAGDTMTGVLAVTAGTAALPAITPSGDPNTGIYSPSADQLAISTGGVQRLLVDASGITTSGLNGGPLAGARNRIINGNFDFWQRGTSFSVTGTNTYTADRWLVFFDGTGATRTISQQSFTLGQTDVPNEPKYFLRFDQSVAGSGSTLNSLDQRIEDVRTFAGQQVTLSFWAKAAASATMPNVKLLQSFGPGGSAQVFTTVASNVALTTSWQRFSYQINLPSISGKTIGTSDSLALILTMPLNATFTIDIAQVQLEPGPVATPFEQRPVGTELALCQRYYQPFSDYGFVVANGSNAGNVQFSGLLLVPMRATPTKNGAVGTAMNISPASWVVSVPPGSSASVASLSAEL